jgi:hypothetical protein
MISLIAQVNASCAVGSLPTHAFISLALSNKLLSISNTAFRSIKLAIMFPLQMLICIIKVFFVMVLPDFLAQEKK